MRRHPLLLLLLLPALLLAACTTPAPEAPVRERLNDNFLAEDLDVSRYEGIFEGESREVFVQRERIAASLGPLVGRDVADVGAGTGLFTGLFSTAAGEHGRVYAVDISERFVEHVAQRSAQEGWTNVTAVLADERDCNLARASVDLVFVCDTYHHFTYPRTTLDSLRRALRRGGELWIVDFERIPGVSREWILGHVRAGKQDVIAEIEAAGFTLVAEVEIAGLEENYVLRFRR
jgi:SAM-dependent methyltransferase